MNTDMRKQKVTNLLSMAARARRIASGAFAVEEAAKKGKAKYLLIAEDAETASKKKYETLSDTYGIPAGCFLTREELGACLGKEYRAAAALLDDGFAKKLEALMEG
ncbi:MAG: ribosomal L7Ae/L30e/S12e/Gadd45 family protein [Selenomonadaceae bacterium]|nr:ribosomal L7Ae/L30e/S12e/Gadd45 family protein [Selenomonadaceae bacterium]